MGISSSSTVASSSLATSSSSTLLAEINALKAELAALLAQAGQTPATASIGPFTRNLSLGMNGGDVKDLQNFLIAQADGPAAAKLQAHGVTKSSAYLLSTPSRNFKRKRASYLHPVTLVQEPGHM
jgi:hypothetical protein